MKSSFTRICDLSNFVDKEVILAGGWLSYHAEIVDVAFERSAMTH